MRFLVWTLIVSVHLVRWPARDYVIQHSDIGIHLSFWHPVIIIIRSSGRRRLDRHSTFKGPGSVAHSSKGFNLLGIA